jgi:hypothetical protein
MALVSPWTRPGFSPTARRARVRFWALLDGARIDDALERARTESDARAWDALDVTVRPRASDGGRLDSALEGRPRMTLEARSDHERHAAERALRYAEVSAEHADAPTHEVLRAALGLQRALAEEGDLVLALDGATARWWSPDELVALAPDRPFVLDEHVQVVVEAVERRPGVGHLVRSRGLAKMARPDVGARVPRRDAERVSELVRDVARLLADGAVLVGGDRLRVPDLPPITFLSRTEDALADAPSADAPLYELRDLDENGNPAPTCERLLAALRPKPRLKVIR